MASDDAGFVGRTLADRYEIVARIGSGGMSTVYEARDTQLGRAVAIKVFSQGEARNDARRQGEVDVLARLNHPNLVTMYDAHLTTGDSAEPSFLVMELVQGPDLRSTLDHGPLRGEIAAQLTTDIAEALAAMHAQAIVHRDLKPANILLAPTGLQSPAYRAKLADFGIAHLLGADRMTTAGTVVGTAAYLSPEQAVGEPPGPESDVYALGLVVLEALTGHREYPGTIVEAMSARASRDPRITDDVPPGWASLLTRMTARDPGLRPSAREVAVISHEIAGELVGWHAEPTVQAADDSTAAMLPPTRVMAAPGILQPAPDAEPEPNTTPLSEPAEPRKRRAALPWLVAAAVLVVIGGAIWLGAAFLPQAVSSGPVTPAPASVVSTATETAAPAEGDSPTGDPVATTAPPADTAPPAETTTTPVSPTTPPETTSPTATATPATGNGNGNGNGNNGNHGNGNNGNGNGNGGNGNG